jgi:ubiquinol-cytochrome c reductase subunit 8
MATIRGLITYTLSPFEQRAFAGVVVKGIPNTIRRLRENFFRVVPPFAVAYVVYDQVEKEHTKQMRKNPEDFECDQ